MTLSSTSTSPSLKQDYQVLDSSNLLSSIPSVLALAAGDISSSTVDTPILSNINQKIPVRPPDSLIDLHILLQRIK